MAADVQSALHMVRIQAQFITTVLAEVFAFAMQNPWQLAAVHLALALFALQRYLNSPWRKLPPGPRGYPIVGNVKLFLDASWLFRECPKFGDVVYLNVVGQPIIMLNTQKAAADLLDRRAAAYSGRPRTIVGHELMCGGLFFAFEPHTDRWRRQRRIAHEGFTKAAANRFHAAQVEDAVRLGAALAQNPRAFRGHYKHYVASVVLSVTYDRPLRGGEGDAALLAQIEGFVQKNQASLAVGAHYVELVPWLVHLPEWLAKWKRDAMAVYRDTTTFFMGLFDDVDTRMKQGESRPCLVATLVEQRERFQVSKLEAAWAAGVMYAAGSDTLANTLEWWTLAMTAFPETQRRAQAELDTVVGRGRPPAFTDRAHLPYVNAVLREVLRWRTGLPLGLPHTADEDGSYEGMYIPKGALLFANILPCNSDPAVYGADARKFRPERHLNEKGQLAPAPPATKEHGHVSFGFGRRVCVGQHVADDTLFISTAVMLWAFEFKKACDENGREMPVDAEGFHSTGLNMAANPFECVIEQRFPEAASMLKGEEE